MEAETEDNHDDSVPKRPSSSFLPQLVQNTLNATTSITFSTVFSTTSSTLSSTFSTETLMVGTQFATKSRPPPLRPYLDDDPSFKNQQHVYNLPLTSLNPIPIVLDENMVIRHRRTSDVEHPGLVKHVSDAEHQPLQYTLEDQPGLLIMPDHVQSSDLNLSNDTVDSQRLAYLEEVAVKTISEFKHMSEMTSSAMDSVPENILSAVNEPERILYEHDYGFRNNTEGFEASNEKESPGHESEEDINSNMKSRSRKRAVGDFCQMKCCRCSSSFAHKCKRKGRRSATSSVAKEMLLKRRRFVSLPTEYHCPKCDKKVQGKVALKEHLAVHTRENTFGCPLCNEMFTNRRVFHAHISTHNPNKEEQVADPPKTAIKRSKRTVVKTAKLLAEEIDQYVSQDVAAGQLINLPVAEVANEVNVVRASPSPAVASKGSSNASKTAKVSVASVKVLEKEEPMVEVSEQDGTYDFEGDMVSSDDGEVYRVEDQNWDCNLCKVKCKGRTELVEHQSIEHEEYAIHACTVCCRRFRRKAQMNRHMLIHTGIKAFECDICNEQFSRRHHLDRHKLTHVDDKPFECDQCHKQFIRASQLELHKSRHVCTKTLISCPVCSKKFLYELAMEKHLNKHSKDSDLTCYKCDIRFKDPVELSKHKTQAHKREKAFECSECKKSFSQEVYLKKHMTIHFGSTPFHCKQCDRGFLTNGDLQRHIKTHDNPIDLTCHVCNKTFNRKDLLQNHMLRHNGERQFTCETCGKSFFLQKHLKQHKYSHLPEKPFCCETCGKTFTLNHNLQQHKLIHTGQRHFVCDECGRGFMRNDQLRKHKANAHGPVEELSSPKALASKNDAADVSQHTTAFTRYLPQPIQMQSMGQPLPELHVMQSMSQPSSSKQYFTVASAAPPVYEAKKYDPLKFEVGKFEINGTTSINLMTGKLEPSNMTGLIPSTAVLMPSSGLDLQPSTSAHQDGLQYLQLSSYQPVSHGSSVNPGHI